MNTSACMYPAEQIPEKRGEMTCGHTLQEALYTASGTGYILHRERPFQILYLKNHPYFEMEHSYLQLF